MSIGKTAEYIDQMQDDRAQWWADYDRFMNLDRRREMPKVGDIYQSASAHLKADDLGGKARRVVIESYELVDFDDKNGKKAKKVVLRFVGKEKSLVLNKTNANIVAAHFGDDLDGWLNNEIIIYPTKVDFGGEMVDAIRVKEPEPELAPEDNDVPF